MCDNELVTITFEGRNLRVVVRVTEGIVVIFTIGSTQLVAKLFSEGIFRKVRAPLGEIFRCFTHPPCLVFMVLLQHGGGATYKALSGKY